MTDRTPSGADRTPSEADRTPSGSAGVAAEPASAGADGLAGSLRAALARLARLDRLLVASDYDGVMAPIVTDPARAFPQPAAVAAVRALAGLPGTVVALISGRPRTDLARLSGLASPVELVGGHGSEFTDQVELTPAQAALRQRLLAALTALVADYPGVWLETKPTSLVVHTRPATAELARQATEATLAGPGQWPDVHVTTGKQVVELAVTDADKGTALTALRRRHRVDGVLFLGDDVTDENAFAVLEPGRDVGVKVGEGDTRAGFRVPDPGAATTVLEQLLQQRRSRSYPGRNPTSRAE